MNCKIIAAGLFCITALCMIAHSSVISGDNTITIKAVGDIVPFSDFPAGKFQRPIKIESQFDGVGTYLEDHDLLVCDFTGPITSYKYCAKNTASSKYLIAFRYPPNGTENLMKKYGFNLAHIANNHSRDFGETGLYDTVRYLSNAGLACDGFKNQIVYKKLKGLTVAAVGFYYGGNLYNSMYDETAAVKLVKEARTNADIVVITMHAGAEGIDRSHIVRAEEMFHGEHRGDVYRFTHLMIDSGADCVIGSGPHIMRGIEMYKGKVIAYSLGNFIGYGGALCRVDSLAYSGILELKLTPKGELAEGRIIPVYINEMGLPVYDKKMRTADFLSSLSARDFPDSGMLISNNGDFVKK
jgi:hypothetical protein